MAHKKKPNLEDSINEDWKSRDFVDDKRTRSEHIDENTKGTGSEHIENTQRTHWEHRTATDLETFSIRIDAESKRKLAAYFERRGLAMSQGLRVWILERMENEGL